MEKEYANELYQEYLREFDDGLRYFCKYFDFDEKLKQCDYEKLKEECAKLGLTICKLNETPFDKAENKREWNKAHGIAIYTETSLNNKPAKFTGVPIKGWKSSK